MRILVADDQTRVRFALRALLERQSGLEVVGEAINASGLLAEAEARCPDLLLLDWELPNLAPGDLLPQLRQACPNLMVIALSGRPEARTTALTTGADAFVCKCDPPDSLLAAIRTPHYR